MYGDPQDHRNPSLLTLPASEDYWCGNEFVKGEVTEVTTPEIKKDHEGRFYAIRYVFRWCAHRAPDYLGKDGRWHPTCVTGHFVSRRRLKTALKKALTHDTKEGLHVGTRKGASAHFSPTIRNDIYYGVKVR